MSKQIDLSLNPKSVNIESGGYSAITVELIDVEVDSVLVQIDLKDVVRYFDTDLLDEIGVDACKKYFDLIDNN